MTQTRESNRAQFPESAKILDMFRAVFGEDTKLTYASENGREVGKKQDMTNAVTPSVIYKAKGKQNADEHTSRDQHRHRRAGR